MWIRAHDRLRPSCERPLWTIITCAGASCVPEHRASEEFYLPRPGAGFDRARQFTALETWGSRSGLETAGFTSQTAFSPGAGEGNEARRPLRRRQSEAERTKARWQLKTLIHPEGMGNGFQVLIQQKGVSGAQLPVLSWDCSTVSS